MLFRETVAVYCENHTEHTDTLCGQNAVYINSVRTSQETHYVSVTKPSQLMLFREMIAVCCENHTEHIDTLCGQNAQRIMLKQVVHIRRSADKSLAFTISYFQHNQNNFS
jgi:hypothetical protein